MGNAFAEAGSHGWILSGSISELGKPLVPLFDLVVFLRTPTKLRIERLHARDRAYGAEALSRHEEFLANLTCPVLRLNGSEPVEALVAKVREFAG